MDFLNHPETERIIRTALAEDIGDGDHTTLSTIPAGARDKAHALVKGEGVIAGVAVAQRVFAMLDPEMRFEALVADGQEVKKGDIAFRIEGKVHAILSGERVALNIMQRMSGIATQTKKLVKMLEGTKCRLLDTRKTTPGFRHFEKWAVALGGATNHRTGLYDMILIKDNHIAYAGGAGAALERAKEYVQRTGRNLKIEIEATTLQQVEEILKTGGAFRILLDNMEAEMMRTAVGMVNGQCETEASGNITAETIRAKAESGVDYLSMGALTHSYKSLDISLDATLG